MAIQNRRGNIVDLDPYKLLPGELGVSLDNKEVRVCFEPGDTKTMATKEDFQEQIDSVSDLIDTAEDAIEQIESLLINKAGINDATPTLTEAYSGIKIDQLFNDAKTYASGLFANVTSFKVIVVDELPTEDIEELTIYLVHKVPNVNNNYDEYMYINNSWEHIGSTEIDLSNYYTKDEIDNNVIGKTYEGAIYIINNPYRYGGALLLKGQLHCHTTNSDGINSPSDLVTGYKNEGYHFITITDHNFITPDPAISGITWIGSGCEESYARHLNAFDITSKSSGTNTQDIIDYHNASGKLVSLNHINWDFTNSIMTHKMPYEELIELRDYNFIEIYNGGIDSYAETQWDWALSMGMKVFGTATDDTHNMSTQLNKGWVVVYSDVNDKANILDNLRKGNFYASNGNDIAISLNENVITATSTETSNISFIGRNGKVLQTNNGVTSATYTIKGDELYVRVKSQKVSDGKYAWSQPVFIDCIGGNGNQMPNIKFPLNSIERQAVMNSNFDICQRGTSAVNPANGSYLADRWKISYSLNGVLPTITHSRQSVGAYGEIENALYFYRVNINGAGSGIDAGTYNVNQYIENGTSLLCGWGKKVTVSFYAKSDIPNKKIGVYLEQLYGTGGSSPESLKGKTFTLSPTWTKYTVTFVTNNLGGKTISNNDDSLRLKFVYAWGSDVASSIYTNDTGAETFVGAGNIDLAQVQLNSGDRALPFSPKPYHEELNACLRYFERISGSMKLFGYSNVLLNTGAEAQCRAFIDYKAIKRKIPTVSGSLESIALEIAGVAAQTYNGVNGFYYITDKSCIIAANFTSTQTYGVPVPLYIVLTSNDYVDINADF